jgi:hypothetical protein
MLWADFSRFSAFHFLLSLAGGFGGALGWLWGSFRSALGSHWGRNRLPINTLWGGFARRFYFLLSTCCFCRSVALGGFAPPFDVGSWMFDVGCSVVNHKRSKYSSPLPPPSGWSGGTLDIPWTYPGTIDHPQCPIFKQASLSNSKFESGLLPGTGLLRPGLPRNRAASRALPGRSTAAARLRSWRWGKTARKPAKLAYCRPPPALAGWGRNE